MASPAVISTTRSAVFVAEARAALARARVYRMRGWRETAACALDAAAANRSAARWFRSQGR